MKRLLLTLIILLLSLPAQAQLIIVAKKKSGADTTPPAMSNPIPTGSQSCVTNPNSIILGITTDENATCKYSLSDEAYASMGNTYSTTGTMTHTQVLSLACGGSYTYYSRCQDSIPNTDITSAIHSFSIASESVGASGYLSTEDLVYRIATELEESTITEDFTSATTLITEDGNYIALEDGTGDNLLME